MTPETAPGPPRRRRSVRFAGWLLLAMLILSVLRQFAGDPMMWLAGACAFGAAALLWPRIGRQQRLQVVIITGFGILFGAIGFIRGAPLSIEQALGQNQVILAMLAAVSFLKLVNRPVVEGERIPAGRGAFVRTLFGLHVFGAAINITALIIVADRLAAQAKFGLVHALMVSRSFCLAVMYSPFIGGMALALALAPGSRLEVLAAIGIPLSLVGLTATWLLLARSSPDELDRFKGYPVHLKSLWIPALLAVSVAVLHRLYPDLSVLVLISITAPTLVSVVMFASFGMVRGALRLGEHVRGTLPDMSGELLLFLSAGILAAGLTSVFASFGHWTPFDAFGAGAAAVTLAAIVLVSIIGVHPIVCVSFLAPLLAPLHPEPNLLALVFVSGWAIGCTVSPFSGTNLTMQGRYGVSAWSITRGNLGYAAVMVAACSIAFVVFAS